jgi:hypothetical protein
VDRRVRSAEPADVAVLLELVHELAAYEREPDAVETTEGMLAVALFAPARRRAAGRVDDLPGRRRRAPGPRRDLS